MHDALFGHERHHRLAKRQLKSAGRIQNAYVSASVKIPDLVYYKVLRGFECSDPKNQKAGSENFAQRCGIEHMGLEMLREYSRQYAALKKRGIKIDDDDILIGSLAIERNAVLVTNNERHFSCMEGIRLENWTRQENHD